MWFYKATVMAKLPEGRGILKSLDLSDSNDEDEINTNLILDSRGQAQNVKDARVYVFGETDITEKSYLEKTELVQLAEMRKRNERNDTPSVHSSSDIVLHETILEKDDTLQKIALRYSCQVKFPWITVYFFIRLYYKIVN